MVAILAAAGSLIAWGAWNEPPRSASKFVENSLRSTTCQYEKAVPQMEHALGIQSGKSSQSSPASSSTSSCEPAHGFSTSRGLVALLAALVVMGGVLLSVASRRLHLAGEVAATLASLALLADGISATVVAGHAVSKLANNGVDILSVSVTQTSLFPALGASAAGAIALSCVVFF